MEIGAPPTKPPWGTENTMNVVRSEVRREFEKGADSDPGFEGPSRAQTNSH